MADPGTDTALAMALSTCKTRQEAAKQAGVSERTVYRRLNDPEFRKQLLLFRQQIATQIVHDLSNAASAAVRVLHGLAVNAEDDNIKLKAANSILEHFQSLPNEPRDANHEGSITEAELARKLEIAYRAGKYNFVLPTSGALPPELAERIPEDPRQQTQLLALVEKELARLHEQGIAQASETGNAKRLSEPIQGEENDPGVRQVVSRAG